MYFFAWVRSGQMIRAMQRKLLCFRTTKWQTTTCTVSSLFLSQGALTTLPTLTPPTLFFSSPPCCCAYDFLPTIKKEKKECLQSQGCVSMMRQTLLSPAWLGADSPKCSDFLITQLFRIRWCMTGMHRCLLHRSLPIGPFCLLINTSEPFQKLLIALTCKWGSN